MKQKLLIRDLTLRDGQQSSFATRMNQSQIDRCSTLLQRCGILCNGSVGWAVPDAVMRIWAKIRGDRLKKSVKP